MKIGDRIRLQYYCFGEPSYTEDHTVEEFRYCLGFFCSDNDRLAGNFTTLCELYEVGPDSETKYISH